MCAAARRLKMTSKECILRLRRRGAAKRGGRQLGGGQVERVAMRAQTLERPGQIRLYLGGQVEQGASSREGLAVPGKNALLFMFAVG
jgi:hypothetical protein